MKCDMTWKMKEKQSTITSIYLSEGFISRIQELLFWRRPLISLFFSVVINLILFLIYYLDLSFLSTIGLLGAVRSLFLLLCPKAFDSMFRNQKDENDTSTNRIRTLQELKPKIQRLNKAIENIKLWFDEYVKNPTLKKNFIFFGFSALSFITAETLGTVFIFWILIDSVLFITPLLVNPKINEFAKNHFQTQ